MVIPRTAVDFLALEAIDGLMTAWVMRYPWYEETNPVVAGVAHTWLFPLQKIALAGLAIAILIPVARRFPRYVNFGFTAVSVFLIFVLASNFFEIIGKQ